MQDIYVGDTEKGFPLVLVHGFLGSSEMWKPQIDYFKKKYRVITPALPGFGESYKAKSKNSIKDMAKTVLDILEEKKIKNFFLLGHSMGGMIVQEMAIIASEKIIKLICYGTGPIGNIPDRFETMDESRKRLKINGLNVTVNRIAKKWFVEGEKSKYFYLCDKAGKLTSEEAADNALVAMKNWNGLNNLKNIKNPTLVVWGDQDKSYNFSQIDTLNKNIANSELKILNGCSHNAHLEKSDDFNKYVADFLEQN